MYGCGKQGLLIYSICFQQVQKLIAYEHLEGDPGLDGGTNAPLFTDILNMVCSCVDNSSSDRYFAFYIDNTFLRQLAFNASNFLKWCAALSCKY